MNKKMLRKSTLLKRKQLSEQELIHKSYLIGEKVIDHRLFAQASVVYVYLDYKNEVSTKHIIEQAWNLNKVVAVPKIIDETMKFYQITSFEELTIGAYGILEPISTTEIHSSTGLMIMPGVVFDSNCHRIGYGGGFYDRYLIEHPNFKTMALAFDLQIVDLIEVEAHDICPQLVITESQIFYSN